MIRSALKSVLRSRVFLILIVLWIAFSFLLVVVTQPRPYPYYNNGKMPDYQTAVLTQLNGTNLSVYSQAFDEYGQGVQGTVYYNISLAFVPSPHIVASGLAGKTDSTGYIQYNISGIYTNNIYSLNEQVMVEGTNTTINSTRMINLVSQNPYSSYKHPEGILSITPVIDKADPSLYSLHLWKPRPAKISELSIFYDISPTLVLVPTGVPPYNYNYSSHLTNVNLSYEANIPTTFMVHGDPYYYGVNINYQSGGIAGTYIFGPLKTPSVQSDNFLSSLFGISSILIFLGGYVFSSMLVTAEQPVMWGKRRKLLTEASGLLASEKKSVTFRNVVITSTLASLPFILVVLIFGSITSFGAFGIVPGYAVTSYALAMVLMAAMGASIMALGMLSRYRTLFEWNNVGERKTRIIRSLFWVAFFVWQYYFLLLNANGLVYPVIYKNSNDLTLNLLVSNIVNPSSYAWLLGEFASRNLFLVDIYSFNPAKYGLSWLLISAIGLIWLFVVAILPYLYLRHADLRMGKSR